MQAIEIEDVEAINSTPKALLCRTSDGREFWVPRSIVDEDSEIQDEDDMGTLLIPLWFAEKEELI